MLTKGKLPTRTWVEVVTTAHRVGMPVELDDDVRPRRQPAPLGRPPAGAGRIQDETRRLHRVRAAAVRAHTRRRSTSPASPGPGPTLRDNLAVHAHGADPAARPDRQHPDLAGSSSASTAPGRCCSAGANDLGGTLMEETISRMAGSEHGSAKTVEELVEIGAGIGRPVRQRTTTYSR